MADDELVRKLRQALGADLHGADLHGADLGKVDLREANLIAADLSGAKLVGADLSRANLSEAYLIDAWLTEANLGAANLGDAKLVNANLSWANLGAANLTDAKLIAANLSWANLGAADLSRADLHGANLHGADLGKANLREANLGAADLSRADLGGADLYEADLRSTILTETIFQDVVFYETTFADLDLSGCKGLETCKHWGPSVIDIRTLQRSGSLPLTFMRGVGLPDTLIDYLPSLLNQAIHYYSCFISYSIRDEDFVVRLHADLQNNGVRCWFAPEDLKIGAELRPTFDEAIRVRDKLLIVLSANSLARPWVKREVEKGLDEEMRSGKTKLFPVRLDEAIFQETVGGRPISSGAILVISAVGRSMAPTRRHSRACCAT